MPVPLVSLVRARVRSDNPTRNILTFLQNLRIFLTTGYEPDLAMTALHFVLEKKG